MSHRAPWECSFAKEERSRCLPGKKPRSDREYFEVLFLCILQAGLSWASVRRSWPRYRSAFLNFEVAKLAHAAPAAQIGKGCVHNSAGALQACGPVHRGVLPSLRGAVRICSLNVAA